MTILKAFPLGALSYKKLYETRTHICETDDDGFPTKVLCSVSIKSVLDDATLAEPPEKATCPVCQRKLKKINVSRQTEKAAPPKAAETTS